MLSSSAGIKLVVASLLSDLWLHRSSIKRVARAFRITIKLPEIGALPSHALYHTFGRANEISRNALVSINLQSDVSLLSLVAHVAHDATISKREAARENAGRSDARYQDEAFQLKGTDNNRHTY
jgi:hypothetical protein